MEEIINKEPVQRVIKALEVFDKSLKVQILQETAKTAKDAANALNCEEGAIVKSLVFKADTEFLICLVSGDKYVSLDKITNLVNETIIKASADECKEFTGFSIGGVSPIALDNKPKSIFIDNNLSKYKKVFAAAGHPHVVFGLSYLELCDLTNGTEDNITE